MLSERESQIDIDLFRLGGADRSHTLDPLDDRQARSRDPGSAAIVLEVLFHPDSRRIGQAAAERFPPGTSILIGRDYPFFTSAYAASDAPALPLADPCISREQVEIFRADTQAFVVRRAQAARRDVVLSTLSGVPIPLGEPAPLPLVIRIGDRVLLLLRERSRARSERSETAELLGESEAMEQLRAAIYDAARSESNVLIQGESGAGKELVARSLHRASARRDSSYIVVNCAAIPETLLESELFGHVKGAFTGAASPRTGFFSAAGQGTIVLDEVGELPSATQAKLLRVLQERTYYPLGSERPRALGARVIASTNRDLSELANAGRFRSDLYYRLSTLLIEVPPLRERREDVALLFAHFFAEAAARHPDLARLYGPPTRNSPAIPLDFVESLVRNDWPGNVRQLKNIVERVAMASVGRPQLLVPAPVASELAKLGAGQGHSRRRKAATSAATTPSIDPRTLIEALERSDHVQRRAARLLGVTHSTVDRLMQEFGLRRPADLSRPDVEAALTRHGTDLDAVARELRISRRGLALRMHALGMRDP